MINKKASQAFITQISNPIYNLQKKIEKGQKQELKIGHWNQAQNIKYIMFVQFFQQKFTKKQNRRLWKIFKIMSMFIKSRTSNQCRSHHQKMEKHCKSIKNIIQNFKILYPSLINVNQKKKKELHKLNSLMSQTLIENFQNFKEIPFQYNLEEEYEDDLVQNNSSKIILVQKAQQNNEQKTRKTQIRSKKQKKLTIQLMLEKQELNNGQEYHAQEIQCCFKKKETAVQEKQGGPTLNTFKTFTSELNIVNNNNDQFPPKLAQIPPNWPMYYYPLQYLPQNPHLYYNHSAWNQYGFGWPN